MSLLGRAGWGKKKNILQVSKCSVPYYTVVCVRLQVLISSYVLPSPTTLVFLRASSKRWSIVLPPFLIEKQVTSLACSSTPYEVGWLTVHGFLMCFPH